MSDKIKLGAVAYASQVAVVWEIIAKFFEEEGHPIDTVFYKDYRTQIKDLLDGKIDIAWNSPLAHVEADIKSKGECGFSMMRDTDQDRTSCYIAKVDSGIDSFEDMRGKTIGFGAKDSPQARLIPIESLREAGLEPEKDYTEKDFDVDQGLDGDHIGGEIDALEALKKGEVDVAVIANENWEAWTADGTINKDEIKLVERTGTFDHCIFTLRPGFPAEAQEEWESILGRMDYNNPEHKEMMDMEGLKKWVPGRDTNFTLLRKAVDYLNFFE